MEDKYSLKILNILLEQNLINQEQYQGYFDIANSDPKQFEKRLLQEVSIDEEEYTKIKAQASGLDYKYLLGIEVDEEVLKILSQELAVNYQVVIFNLTAGEVQVGLVDPGNYRAIQAIDYLVNKKNYKAHYYLISQTSFNSFIKNYGNIKEEVHEALDLAERKFGPDSINRAEDDDNDHELPIGSMIKTAPVSKIVSVILRHAVEGGASDVHIEPLRTKTQIRYRIDGILHVSIVLPIYIHAAIVSRIKVLSNLKIDETRAPQDGRIRINYDGKDVDFRVSILPLANNEKVVMRILESPEKAPTFEELGFMGRQLESLKKNIEKPNGMFLVTGPTGSGKSTTLFSALDVLNKEEVNISTLEDPVEYSVEGVNQSQIRPEVGFTFATGLRSLLRQDPDVIMVGEVRDTETAKLAINAALTGHFVLSTLHTNDARGAIPRLIDMGSEVFLLANTLNLILAQRLVRKICQHCKVEEVVPEILQEQILKELSTLDPKLFYPGIPQKPPFVFYRGQGCVKCGETGYKGRIAISEVIDVSRKMREIISRGFKTDEVDQELKNLGFIEIAQDGWMKALLGQTTVEEILRVTKTEE